MSQETVLRLEHIRKEYPGTIALKDVSIELKKGEILALAGENGAGKSTLIKTCSGAVIPTSGKIIVGNNSYTHMTPKLARQNNILIIYQEINNVAELTVAENMFLGRPIRNGILIDKTAMEEKAHEALEQLDIHIDVRKKMKDISIATQQMIEIAKAILFKTDILIMDEPSVFLSDLEVKKMFSILRNLRKNDVSIIYISHRLNELFSISDRIAILRDGEYIKTLTTTNSTKDELIHCMVGRELKNQYPIRTQKICHTKLLEIQNLTGNSNFNINFDIHQGEIVGLGGLVGSGRTELANMLFGITPIKSGKIFFKGKEIQPKNPQEAINMGIALLTEDRINLGTINERSITENICIPIYKKISKLSLVNQKAEDETAIKYKNKLAIKVPSISYPIMNLSGGNQQKVIIGRWLAVNSDLLIFDEPTVGIDVGAKYEIYKLMNELVEKENKAILMISSDMEELLRMSDRIVVLSEGRQTGILKKEDFSQEKVMELATSVESKTNEGD